MNENKNKKKIMIVIALLIVLIIIGIISYKTREVYYEVSFQTEGGEVMDSLKLKKGATISDIPEPTKSGYTFLYWTVDGAEVDDDYKITKNTKLVAVWKKKDEKSDEKEYIVTFDTDGGSIITSQKVKEGEKAKKPLNPTKSGYTFKEWQEEGKTYNFDKEVEKDITLKAVWEKEEEKAPTQPTQQSNQTQPTPQAPANQTNSGGKSNGGGSATITNNYIVNFDSNGGSAVASQIIAEGGKVTKPANPTREGYNFKGWTLDGLSYDFNSIVNMNITLKATWSSNKTYTIKIEKVDEYSPDRYLTVYENGKAIAIQGLMYTDNVAITISSNGTRNTVSSSDIAGESEFKVKLQNGSIVTAKIG